MEHDRTDFCLFKNGPQPVPRAGLIEVRIAAACGRSVFIYAAPFVMQETARVFNVKSFGA
jgi:hypothetical protein